MESNPFDYGPNRHEAAKLQAQWDMRQDQIRAITPTTVGTWRCFNVGVRRFIVKKSTSNTWSMWETEVDSWSMTNAKLRLEQLRKDSARVRFGTLAEIQEDISYVLDIGELPPRKGFAP